MSETALTVIAALVVLLASVIAKYVSTMRLWARYRPEEYWAIPQARRLFLIGKVTPLLASGALVVLSFCTGFVWPEVAALLLFATISIGVTNIIWKQALKPHRRAPY